VCWCAQTPEARPPSAATPLIGRLEAMTNCPYCRTVCSFRHHYNLRNSYCKLCSLNRQCFQLLMKDRAHRIYSTFAIPVALLYLFFESWNCWIFTVISLSYIQFDLNNLIWRISWRINWMASHNYFKWQKINSTC